MTQKLRLGDIYTHMYSGLRHELDRMTLVEGRKDRIYFDVGRGWRNFKSSRAVPMMWRI
jgi:dihydroorotase